MKTIRFILITLYVASAVSACTPQLVFSDSSIVPSASGKVGVRKDKNKNYVVNVNVRNLAEPKKLSPPMNTYVVWMESGSDPVNKLGQLLPAGRALEARLKATSTAKPDNIYITAEDNAEVMSPSGQTILTTKK
ncbi:hypothetical protein [Spirosoma gilvum]